jgi:hypothetical protein
LAGQSGSCWANEDTSQNKGQADVIVYHGTTPPTGDEKISDSKRLYKSNGNDDVMIISVDNASDIYYARCKTPGSQASILVDAV